jgi:transcriptional regulator with XRE-family HTH domain
VSFGQQLRELRRGLDLTQAELAHRVGCGVNAIRKLEAGERRPSRDFATRLASVLGLDGTEQSEFVKAARGIQTVSRASLPAPVSRLIGREMDVAPCCGSERKLTADRRCAAVTSSHRRQQLRQLWEAPSYCRLPRTCRQAAYRQRL